MQKSARMRRDDIETRVASLYGEVDWHLATGILHVAAIETSTRAVLAIGPRAPRCETDRFVLGFARARADLLVTTGAILRAEPDLVHRHAEDPELESAFHDWRLRILGKSVPASLVVLSRSGDLPSDHPALVAADSGFVWTSPAGRERLGASVARLSVEVSEAGNEMSGVEAALRAARVLSPFDTALIEAGPSSSSALYREGPRVSGSGDAQSMRVDELLLSCFEGRVAAEVVGSRFVSEAAMASLFPRAGSSTRIQEASGSWRFERYRTESVD